MLRASRIPRRNIVTLARYTEGLADNGFGGIEVRDLSEQVMLGFSSWWERYREGISQLPMRSRLKYGITARFLRWAYRNNVLRYVALSARRN